jgi:L-methionine (R)-S-oxide reductase
MPKDGTALEPLLRDVKAIVEGGGGRDDKLAKICGLLRDRLDRYDWVGFYIADLDRRVLHLGPYVGEPTEHVQIPFGRGVCGQAAQEGSPLIVQDVSRESNYLSCSPLVRSEIVVPILKNGRAVAQIDVDSHAPAAFTLEDRSFLVRLCEVVSNLF